MVDRDTGCIRLWKVVYRRRVVAYIYKGRERALGLAETVQLRLHALQLVEEGVQLFVVKLQLELLHLHGTHSDAQSVAAAI